MSTSDSKDAPSEAAEGSHEPSSVPEPTESIWKTGLQPGQIRLFNMELDEGDGISGTLERFEHKSAPRYLAQSYVCGEGECDFKINVNGNAHYIQPSLSIALRQTKRALQNRESDEESAWLWIDAICIHQSNIAEREMHPTHELRRELFEITNAGPDHKLLKESLSWVAHSIWVRLTVYSSVYVFTTLRGLVGCSPKPVSAGDRICIVPGGDTLHVFSTAPTRYITCASVHGLMGNDLPDIVRELGLKWEEIAIH
jgi:hypothetical protein